MTGGGADTLRLNPVTFHPEPGIVFRQKFSSSEFLFSRSLQDMDGSKPLAIGRPLADNEY